MKKFYTYILCLIGAILTQNFLCTLSAQQLPDPSFEDWTGATFDGQIQPKHWHYCNVTQSVPVIGTLYFNFSDQRQGRTGACHNKGNRGSREPYRLDDWTIDHLRFGLLP